MAAVSNSVLRAYKADVAAARKSRTYTAEAGTTLDVNRVIVEKDDMLVFYGKAILDDDDIVSVTQATPATGSTRITFNFTLEAGVKIRVFA